MISLVSKLSVNCFFLLFLHFFCFVLTFLLTAFVPQSEKCNIFSVYRKLKNQNATKNYPELEMASATADSAAAACRLRGGFRGGCVWIPRRVFASRADRSSRQVHTESPSVLPAIWAASLYLPVLAYTSL